MKYGLACLFLALALGAAGLWAQQNDAASPSAPSVIVPRLVRFSGVLTDLTGKPLSGPVEATFSVYQNEADAEPVWQETQTVEADATGHYTVLLGAMSAQGLPMELFTSGEARWLGVAAGRLPEQPRVVLVSVPYALEAGDAATLGGKPASAYLLAQPAQGTTAGTATVIATAPGAVGATPAAAHPGESESRPVPNLSETGSANYIPMYSDASLDLGSSVMYQSSGNIGIGTTNPQAPVHIYSSGSTNTTLPGFLFQRPDTKAETHFQHYYPGISYVSQNMYRDVGGLWYLDSAGTSGMAMILSTNAGVEPPNINFLTLPTGGATSPAKVMVIQSSGNVGIGTPTPLTPLQVHPATNANLGVDSQSGEARLTAFNDAGTANVPLNLQASTFRFFNAQGAFQALTIDPAGNLDAAANINSGGTVTASGFSGNGASLTNLAPGNISAGTAGINISGNASTATTAATATSAALASNALSLGGVAASNYARLNTGNSFTGNQSVTGNVSATGSVSGGTASFTGALTAAGAVLPATGTATASQGFASNPMSLLASSFNTGTSAAVPQLFRWQAEPANSNTASPSGTLNLLYLSGAGTPAETGLSIASNGLLTFASGQTFPGTGTISGVTAGAGLSGGGTSGNVPVAVQACPGGQFLQSTGSGWVCASVGGGGGPILGVTAGTDLTGGGASGVVILNLDTTKVPQLAAPNTFAGTQTISTGNLAVPMTTVDASNGVINLGGNPFIHACCPNSTENIFVGLGAGSFNAVSPTSFGGNTGVGGGALGSLTSGMENIAVGDYALHYNTAGNNNVALGQYALIWNDTGNSNVALGACALSSTSQAGSGSCTAGSSARFAQAGGNTAIGVNSGTLNINGSYNTFAGFQADGSFGVPLTNATAIGACAKVAVSNALVLGAAAGNLGACANDTISVGIDVPSPTNILTVLQGGGHAIADGWDTYSSRRWKSNIHTLHGALSKVEQLRGVEYTYTANGQRDIGMIAEEVGKVVPEVVSYEDNGKDARGIDYARLTALLIEATKEQQALIQKQQDRIKAQQARLDAQQAEIAQLASEVTLVRASLASRHRTGSAIRVVKSRVAAKPGPTNPAVGPAAGSGR
jgi:hypothetical protein